MPGVLKFIAAKDIPGVNNVAPAPAPAEEVKPVPVYYLYLCCNSLTSNTLKSVAIECFILMFYRSWPSTKWSTSVSQ